MRENVTVENVFRFVQFRPPKPLDPDNTVELRSDTAVAELLKSLAPAERAAHANKYLESRTGELRDLANSAASRRIVDVATETEREGGTVAQFLERVSARDKDWLKTLAAQHLLLSDALLTTKFASQAALPQAMWWIRLFRLQAAVLARPGEAVLNSALSEYLRLPLALPSMFELAVELNGRRPGSNRTPARRASEPSAAETSRREADAVARAFDEVVGLNRPGFLNSPSRDDSSGRRSSDGRAVPFSVTDAGLRRLTTPTREVLDRLGIDLGARSIHSVLAELDAEVARTAARAARTSVVLPSWEVNNQSAPGAQPYLRATGVADLLVVKQHLTGYERVDIAHIENVLIGETKNRTHRLLNRIEETFTEERETTLERETELETAERFEMNRETERTAQQDQQFGFGLTLSGKYGPSVEFSSNAQADVSTSEEETERSATEYAKDVVTRSLDRVVERVREEQIRRILREEEETNLHELKNDTKEHIIGVYQFLEKVYESQVFNYGIRQIFDFMIPEPASYIWHIEASPATDLDLPAAPPNLESRLPNALAVDHTNYLPIAALYGAEGITPPPPLFKSVSVSVKHGDTSGSEEEEPRSISSSEIDVPDGYQPTKAVVRLQGLTDDELSFSVTVGSQQQRWIQPAGGWDVGDDHKILSTALTYDLTGESYQYEDAGKLPFNVLAYESNTYAVAADFTFSRTDAALTEWQVKTYQAIAEAYRERLLQYQQRVEELKAEAEAEAGRSQFRFGAPPSQNAKTVKDELKKHCISVITRQWYDDFNALQDAVSPNPPEFDFVDAESEGDFIRFFEQAFEWDQMQFVFYPYFWARKDRWADRFKRQDVDPLFLDFLRAGAARAVVPVRPGFEVAVNHYLEQKALTGEDVIWNGEGDPPEINSPLYLPIVTEIKERTGASLGELPVGDPWPTNLPTPIVTLRREKTLPEWTRVNPLGWEWQEA